MDEDFIKAHGKFGRSRPERKGAYPDMRRYGSRKSSKLVRCYPKEETDSYRVELELHRDWLRRYDVMDINDLPELPGLLFPKHVRFCRVDWDALARHLRRRYGWSRGEEILEEVRTLSTDLYALLSYLREDVRVKNVHRFLVPLPENKKVERALRKWAARWTRAEFSE